MKIINFYGSPGKGKTTLAYQLFAYMKKLQYNVEIASEYAKDCVYQERYLTLQDQVYLVAKMNHKFQLMKNANIDFVICDSPLLLNIFYKIQQEKMNYLDNDVFNNFVVGLNNTYNNINLFITSDNSFKYQQNGRIESEKTSNQYSKEIENILKINNEKYIKIINSIDLKIEDIFKKIIGDLK